MRWMALIALGACASTAPDYEGAATVQDRYRSTEGIGMHRASEATRDALEERQWTSRSNADAAGKFEAAARGDSIDWLHASELRLLAGGKENYFHGARDAWRWLQATHGGRDRPVPVRRRAYRLYNHNVAGYAASVDWGKAVDRVGARVVTLERRGVARLKFAKLLPTHVVSTEDYERRIITSGAGGPVMAIYPRDAERDERWPYLYQDVYAAPLCAVLDFTDGAGSLTLFDLHEGEETRLFGRTVPLKVDITATWAYAQQFQKVDDDAVRAEGLRHPDERLQSIYMLHPPDPNRRIALFVHGLNSSPRTFRQLANELGADPRIRRNYQLVAYRYSTGYSLFINNAMFRRRLRAYFDYMKRAAPVAHAAGTVAIGHSMGGLQIKPMAQAGGARVWNRVFNQPPARVPTDSPTGRQLRAALLFEPLPEIRRLVFLAVPHRGSRLASGILAEVGKSSIADDPQVRELRAKVLEEFGVHLRPRIREQLKRPYTSVDSLRPDDPWSNLLLELPIAVPFHSIVGDTAGSKDQPTGDGVVPYESAHLRGAQSELVVQWGHNLPTCPAAQKEVARILLLHLE